MRKILIGCLIFTILFCLLMIGYPLPWKIDNPILGPTAYGYTHEDITALAMGRLRGIPQWGIDKMIDHVNDPDFPIFMPDEYHYNNINQSNRQSIWDAAKNIISEKRWLAADWTNYFNAEEAYAAIGFLFHLVQDFYSHTNWVKYNDDDIIANLEEEDAPDFLNGDGPTLHDYPISPWWDEPRNDSILATIKQWELFEGLLHTRFGNQLAVDMLVNRLGITPNIVLFNPPSMPNSLPWNYVAPGFIKGQKIKIKWAHAGINHYLPICVKLYRDGVYFDDIISSGIMLNADEFEWTVGQCLTKSAPYDNSQPRYKLEIRVTTPAGDIIEQSEPFYILDPLYGQPYYLKAKADNWNCITLSWNDGASGESQYKIYRKKEGENDFSLIKTLAANTKSTTDNNIIQGVIYYYRIVAEFPNGKISTGPNEASTSIIDSPPVAPQNVNWYFKAGIVQIIWTEDPTNEQGVIIERKGGAEANYIVLGQLPPDVKKFYDYNPPQDPTGIVYYRLRFFNPRGSDECIVEVDLPLY
ncbi:MAG: Cell surface protein [Candidatus Saccharicenans subterraneus]|uniref:Cell surface protein n=1 Tax=Candidatus Saccharicenans subterraneus TaxID=2508984 RepID=A0A3E2BL27_9BACT|nr:MAG: Cell surface protein [Candidatus Saccharicenans subterraneum]